MGSEPEVISHIKLGKEVPGPKILERRTKGLSAIRRECLSRLARHSGLQAESSLVVRWRGLGALANARTVVDAAFELVLHSGPNTITASFPDRWILCYPEDPEIRQQVEAEMDRMCKTAVQPKAP
jgi:hypothetical protein